MNDSTLPTSITPDPVLTRDSPLPVKKETQAEEFDVWLKAGQGEKHYWLDLWRYRELFVVLAWRDVAVRYKQTIVGVAWSLLQPFLVMIIMTVVFGRLAGLHSDGAVPYAIMVFSGMLPWQFFANSLFTSGQSLTGNSSLISKVYFPRLIVPASTIVVAVIDFLLALLILGGMMVFYRFMPTWHLLLLPLFLMLAFVASLGPGVLVAALNVKYRDFRFLLPFVIQFGLYVCPVGYSSSVVRQQLGDGLFLLYSLNPMVGLIDGFRWAILGPAANFYLPSFLISLAVSLLLLATGIWYFRKMERTFADVI
jgi:lipopolysaccharide transport system permease protein